jgi:hypothetical protein
MIRTEKLPRVDELQDRAAVPEPVILLGFIGIHDKVEGTMGERDTRPPNPFTGDTVIAEVAVEPAFAETADAETLKSTKFNVAVVM